MKHITTADALRALEEAVAEKGEDYKYEYVSDDDDDWRSYTCLYAHNGQPSCIVGNALVRLGVPIAELQGGPVVLIDELVQGTDWPIDPDAVQVMLSAQNRQDGGETWGAALAAARRVVSGA